MQKDNLAAQYDDKTGRLKQLEVDLDKNGTFETKAYMDATRFERIEIDRDDDGVVDRWEYYSDRNTLVKVGSSSRGDGIEDGWEYPDGSGILRRFESDTDRDGRIDKWETFGVPAAGGRPVLLTVELDTDGRGAPTQRLTYRPDGILDRVEQLPAPAKDSKE